VTSYETPGPDSVDVTDESSAVPFAAFSRWTAPPERVSPPSPGGWRSASRLGISTRGDVPSGDVGRPARAVDSTDDVSVAQVVADSHIDISTDPRSPGVWLDGSPVNREIRSAEVTAAVSAVSAVPAVRARLVALQRELIDGGAIVVEGRDIGSVVCPSAAAKVYLTASADTRARRRAGELGPRPMSLRWGRTSSGGTGWTAAAQPAR